MHQEALISPTTRQIVSGTHEQSSRAIIDHSKFEDVTHVHNDKERRLRSPTRQSICQALVHLGIVIVPDSGNLGF